jgi:parallel beta-helix repeat protein
MKRVAIFLIFVLLGISQSVNAATYHVAKNGNDSNPGTESKPWLTIGRATWAGTLKPGDTVYVKEGEYDGKWAVYINISASKEKPITFQAYPGHKVTIVGNQGRPWAFWIDGSYIKIHGFEITGTNKGGIGVQGHHNTISGCIVHDVPESGIVCAYPTSHHNIIEDNVCYRCGLGIGGRSGIAIWQAGGWNTVRRNICYENKQPDELWADGNGIIVDLTDAPGNEVYNNVCYGNDGSGIAITESSNVKVYNNVLYDNGKGALSKTNRCGICVYSETGKGNNTIKNNIMMNNYRAELAVQGGAENLSHDIDYNTYYRTGGKVIEWGLGTFYTLQEFKDNTSYGNNSIAQNPRFINASGKDFHLQSGSPCIDAGTNMGLPYHGAAPDMGAFEYYGAITGEGKEKLSFIDLEKIKALYECKRGFSDLEYVGYDIDGEYVKLAERRIKEFQMVLKSPKLFDFQDYL